MEPETKDPATQRDGGGSDTDLGEVAARQLASAWTVINRLKDRNAELEQQLLLAKRRLAATSKLDALRYWAAKQLQRAGREIKRFNRKRRRGRL